MTIHYKLSASIKVNQSMHNYKLKKPVGILRLQKEFKKMQKQQKQNIKLEKCQVKSVERKVSCEIENKFSG